MKNIKTYFLGVLSLLLFTMISSCDPDPVVPDQDKIYASYKLNYNEKSNKTTASVAFYQNEPSPANQQKYELQDPSLVKYNEDELLFDSEKRTYKKEFIGVVESSFEYSDYFGTTYFNSVEMVDSIDFIQLVDSVSIQQDLYFDLDGNPLMEGEEIIVRVTSLSSEESYIFNTDTITSGTLYFISAQDLSALGTGLTTFAGIRRYTANELDQVNSAGGGLVVEYEIIDTVLLF